MNAEELKNKLIVVNQELDYLKRDIESLEDEKTALSIALESTREDKLK